MIWYYYLPEVRERESNEVRERESNEGNSCFYDFDWELEAADRYVSNIERKPAKPDLIGRILASVAIAWLIIPATFALIGKSPNVLGVIAQEQPTQEMPQVIEPVQALTNSNQPRLLKLSLSLSEPSDLKIRQGDFVKVNQVVSDRTQERSRLLLQKATYQNSIDRLQLKLTPPLKPAKVWKPKDLPPISFNEEAAKIDTDLLKVKAIEKKIDLQKRKIDVLGTLEPQDLPAGVEVHEGQKLAELESQLEAAKAEVELSKGKLTTAQDQRAYQEYQHRQNMIRYAQEQNQAIASYQRSLSEYQRTEQERRYQIASLQQKSNEVDNQIAELSTVRSPYDGEIRRIKFTGQKDNTLTAELLLAVAREGERATKPTVKAKANTAKVTGKATHPASKTTSAGSGPGR